MKKPSILMLEPDEADRFITKIFFDDHTFDADLKFASESTEFFDILQKTEPAELPGLIILNMHTTPLNAPGILKILKTSADWGHIPVVILSGSIHQKLIKECYALGASSFIQKPDTEPDTHKKILNFIKYWFETVELA